MREVRWTECSNQDGEHKAWFPMFLKEAKTDRCPGHENDIRYRELDESELGPGTELMRILKGRIWKVIGIKVTKNCRCNMHARTMNEWGPDKCYENMNIISGWLKEEHAKQKISMPFSDSVARSIISKSIQRDLVRLTKEAA